MRLMVNNDCCACSYCYRACQLDAPYYDGEQVQIDNEKCVGCGKCITACPMGAIYDAENPPKPAEPHEPIHLECDALIVGAGGAGMVAAVRIAEETGKKVIVLEKAKRTGAGAIHVAGPLQFHDTKWALDAGAKPTVDERIKATLDASQGAHNPKLVENTLKAMPRFFDWLCQWANPEEKFELCEHRGGPGGPGGPDAPGNPDGPMMAGASPGGGMGGASGLIVDTKALNPPSPAFHNAGEFIMEKLFARAKEYGVTILNETSAKDFILDDEGQVVGVTARDPGGVVSVSCKACLIAAGSLLRSNMVKRVYPDYSDAYLPRFAHAINVYTGDGVELCERAGIPIDCDNIWLNITGSLVMPCDGLTVEYSEATGKRPLMPTDLRPHCCRPESLMVNQNGERFQNEQYASLTIEHQIKQPQCVSYTIMPEKTIKMQPMRHKKLYDESGRPIRQMVPLEMHFEWNEKHMQWLASLKNRHLVIADTIEELAEKAELPAETLKETIRRYNELCAKGQDEDFHKDPDYMLPVAEGPFYAVRTFLMSDGVEGGIIIDENCQVEGKTGLMKGLYAAGDNTSGNIICKGGERRWITNEYSWALCTGMVSADSIIRQLQG